MVAVLWDVVTFWPRANHPLTPPSYGERAVPELRGYITRTAHLEKAQVRVTVAAHSQGTVIAAAALLLAGAQSHVALMTFGSPLRRLYTQNFPAYFGGAALTTLRVNLSDRWINLWARTDPIGSWVFDDPDGELPTAPVRVDLRVLDVKRLGKWPDEGYSPICGHSGFWLRPAYEQAFRRLQKYMLPGEIAEVPTSQYAPPHTLA
jgi:pimeloyl-ACP methyl ester carboxylesterase